MSTEPKWSWFDIRLADRAKDDRNKRPYFCIELHYSLKFNFTRDLDYFNCTLPLPCFLNPFSFTFSPIFFYIKNNITHYNLFSIFYMVFSMKFKLILHVLCEHYLRIIHNTMNVIFINKSLRQVLYLKVHYYIMFLFVYIVFEFIWCYSNYLQDTYTFLIRKIIF